MPLLYRAMTAHPDGMPVFVRSTRGLSDVAHIPTNDNGTVDPNLGGVSVSPGFPENLPRHRRPPKHGGTGPDPIWELTTEELPPSLAYRPDDQLPDTHGFIEPAEPMSIWDYENGLLTTRRLWRKTEPTPGVPREPAVDESTAKKSITALDGAFQEPLTLLALRDVVDLELKSQDGGAVYRRLEVFRETLRGADREADDEVVLDVMDFLAGWCSPHELL
jgi:hypothetical protein